MNLFSIEEASFFVQEYTADAVESSRLVVEIPEMCINKYGSYALFAPNGSGKTTILNCIFKKPNYFYDGNIYIQNIDVNDLKTENFFNFGIGFLQQNPVELPNISYFDLFLSILNTNKEIYFGETQSEVEKNLKLKMNEFGIKHELFDKKIGLCSSGERKILDLFLFNLFNISVLFIDELDANLDEENKNILISFINKNLDKKLFFIISHDRSFIEACSCKEVFTIKNKIVVKERGKKT